MDDPIPHAIGLSGLLIKEFSMESMRGEALGSGKAQCPSIKKCLGDEAGVCGRVVEHPYKSRGE